MKANECENSILSFNHFNMYAGDNKLVGDVTLQLNDNDEVLLISKNAEVSSIIKIFTFDFFNNYRYSGAIIHRKTNLIDLISNIKKFRINGRRIGITAYILGDILPIPANPLDLFDAGTEVSSQILDFIPYETRIEVLNAAIRREMIKITEIDGFIKDFDAAVDKRAFTISVCRDFGIMDIYNSIYNALQSKKPDRRDVIASLIIRRKIGINLADIVVLRDYYKYRLNLDRFLYENKRLSITVSKDIRHHHNVRKFNRTWRKNIDFMTLKFTRAYSENILKNEFLTLLDNELNLMGIQFHREEYSKLAGDIPVAEIYKLITGIGFLTDKSAIIIDISLNALKLEEISGYVKIMKTFQPMACLYLCQGERLTGNIDKLFDAIVEI